MESKNDTMHTESEQRAFNGNAIRCPGKLCLTERHEPNVRTR